MAREILIADSDKGDQEEFKKIFEMKDYRLIFSENGEDALEQVKFFKPDLIIADTALTEKSGLQVCSLLKADREFKHIPIILIKGIFEAISQRDIERVQADGVISKPLHEGEILSLVDRLMEEGAMKTTTKSLLEDLDKFEDEEIIELTEVVEEPEPRIRIDDLVAPVKEEGPAEIADLLALEKQLEKVAEPLEEELSLQEPMPEKVEPPTSVPRDLSEKKEKGELEKVALEEIFLKMEQLKPSIEKELLGEEEVQMAEKGPPERGETAEKPFSLDEFEAALREEVMAKPGEETRKPPVIEPPKRQGAKEEVFPELSPLDMGALQMPPVKELRVEEPIETRAGVQEGEGPASILSLVEEELTIESLEEALGPLAEGEAKLEASSAPPTMEVSLEEEPLPELVEEEFPQEFLSQAELPRKELAEVPPKEELREALFEEKREVTPVLAEELLEEKEVEGVEKPIEESVAAPPFHPEVSISGIPLEERVVSREEIPPAQPVADQGQAPMEITTQQFSAAIAKGVQAMMEDFVAKIVPEMTQSIVGITMERIERMVKEIVPKMAEKAIQEEIKRLQEEEKE